MKYIDSFLSHRAQQQLNQLPNPLRHCQSWFAPFHAFNSVFPRLVCHVLEPIRSVSLFVKVIAAHNTSRHLPLSKRFYFCWRYRLQYSALHCTAARGLTASISKPHALDVPVHVVLFTVPIIVWRCVDIDLPLPPPDKNNTPFTRNRSKRPRGACSSYRPTRLASSCPARLPSCTSPWPTPTSTGDRALPKPPPAPPTSNYPPIRGV